MYLTSVVSQRYSNSSLSIITWIPLVGAVIVLLIEDRNDVNGR